MVGELVNPSLLKLQRLEARVTALQCARNGLAIQSFCAPIIVHEVNKLRTRLDKQISKLAYQLGVMRKGKK